MALPPRKPGSRRTRQGLERLAVPIRVQRGKAIVGQARRLLRRALPNHIGARQAMRLPYNLMTLPRDYFDLAWLDFQICRNGPFAPYIGSFSGIGTAAML
jgi:hypothetical protein